MRQELIIKGIDKATIEAQINEIKKSYSEEEVVAKIVKDKFTKLKGFDPQKARKRVYAYLLRRGFSPEVIIGALTQIKNRDNEE